MSASSHLFARLLIDRSYEPEMARLVDIFAPRNQDIIDVGANIGFFTVKFAKHLQEGKVLAVEPTRNAIHRLKANVERNGVSDKVVIFEGVVTDREGVQRINLIEGKEEYSTLGTISHPSVSGQATTTHEVTGATLDTLVSRYGLKPGFLKIDVEGSEHLAFAGAGGLLRENRPVILSELCDYLLKANGSSAEAVLAIIRNASYDIYDADDPDRIPGGESYGNVICFPSEAKVTKAALKKAISGSTTNSTKQ